MCLELGNSVEVSSKAAAGERKEASAGKSAKHEENDRENLPEEKNEDLEDGFIAF